MSKEAEIAALLRKLCNINTDFSFIAEVTENYPNEQYVDVKATDETVYPKVRKRSGIDGKKGILATPVKGSSVIVSRLHYSDDLYIAVFGEIESYKIELFNKILHLEERQVLLQSGDFAVKVGDEGVTLNDGSFGGLIKIETLIEKINNIENAFNSLLTSYKIHNHAHPQGSTTAFTTGASTQQNLANTTVSSIENNKVKH